MNKNLTAAIITCCAVTIPVITNAGGITYKDGDKYLKVGGRVQFQYHYEDPDGSASEDELFFRRLRPYIEGSLHKDWKAKIQWDMGKADGENEMAVKDAYFQYKGVNNMKITVGNANFPFSREFLTSSKYQQLVERTFVGDHNYGTPDRQAGIHLTGNTDSKKITWGASVAMGAIDPSDTKLDFDTVVNKNDDFNEGLMVGGRVDWHPMGKLKFKQGDFSGKTKATIGVAAFSWSNDDDNNNAAAGKADVDSVTGIEVSGAFRSSGFSIDAQVNSFDAETVDTTITSGLYKNGETTLDSMAVEAGYMLMKDKLELVAGFQTQDADGYAEEWERTSFGVNYFILKHDAKIQLSVRQGENKDGVNGNDLDEIFVQSQFVF